MKARDIMTSMPVAITPSTKVYEAAEVMKYEEVGCIPVVRDIVSRRLVGIITDRDISVRCTARRHGVGCEVGSHMTPVPLQTVLPDAEVAQVVAKMEAAHVRRIPVVDADGSLLGIVSEADLAAKLPAQQALPMHRHFLSAFRPPLARVHVHGVRA
ncbi:MAG: CBS domain-containing protein [Gemmatimonadaceae bacterium]